MIGVSRKPEFSLRDGFTLIELLVAVAIVGGIAAAVGSLFTTSNEIYSSQEQIVRLQQDIRATLNMMTRNIRMAGLDPTDAGCAGFFEPTDATRLSLRMDYDSDGLCTDGSPEQNLSYAFSAGDSEIQEDGARIAGNIVSLNLCYWLEGAANCIADPGGDDLEDIRRVDISICGRIGGSYSEKYSQTHCFNSTVHCRNMGL